MLQNRIDPWGNIIYTPARGAWMGNRGILHDERKTILRPFLLKAWITCKLSFNGRKRQVMMPHRYTELFFLDEATAFAAGHRPCFECRRQDHNRFKAHWLKGNPEYGFNDRTSIQEVDKLLHTERIGRDRSKITFTTAADELPDGAMILLNGNAQLVYGQSLHQWTPFGYEKTAHLPAGSHVTVLTPRSVINAFKAGYIPQMAIIP
ncbi:hypothetical protein F0L74_10600 [Chitinophaga agrisoli]|uniref:Uncharacterized protein n=1 Tax=Chitinophaga agrisoli TaxID=2607653 RepID=A0A5B2VXB5_9BACT|nr:hypothetical protein [Chitinophaga agrisoli]KAA2242962.1 hypothetical protein F0L74_10600 [Chitinophaga agrisoli]